MANLPTPEDSARDVLDMCSALHLRPGHALPLRPLWQKGLERGLTGEELAVGIKKGTEFGWFESSDGVTAHPILVTA